jgi:AraC family transcriptional regulator, transcriptional activator of pobA
VRGRASGVLRLAVPADDRPAWTARVEALARELAERADGYREAVLAHLTLLLVEVARLAADVVGDLRVNREPLLADVFAVIERRFPEPLSLRDVAREVNLSAGHLTTVVRRRTGRTVQEWIVDRRMTAARRLLAGSDLPVGEIGRRVGYPDPGYFARVFGQVHGVSPTRWRDAG